MSEVNSPDSSASKSRKQLKTRHFSGTLAPLLFLILLSITLSFIAPNFATPNNIKQIAVQAAVVAILACGQTAVIISGNIDLSVGSVMAFAGIVTAQAFNIYHVSVPMGMVIACMAGLSGGLVSGIITAYGRIPSFIVTLGMMGVAQGVAGIVAHSQNIGNLPPDFSVFGFGELFGTDTRDGIPYAVVMMLIAAILVHIALSRTAWGRSLYAIGGNREAARLSGVRLGWAVTSVFALSGLLAGFASIVNISRSSVASKDAGVGYELDAVAATVIGGTSLFGGQGGIPGTIIGAILIYTLRNACTLKDYGPEHQRVIIGVVVVLAVLFDRFGPGRNRKTTA
ncbi:ribose ABC transporter permease [Armatimonadota bacterium]|nr:ribose ABC transporter permease [Armatimonadota bacterium]